MSKIKPQRGPSGVFFCLKGITPGSNKVADLRSGKSAVISQRATGRHTL